MVRLIIFLSALVIEIFLVLGYIFRQKRVQALNDNTRRRSRDIWSILLVVLAFMVSVVATVSGFGFRQQMQEERADAYYQVKTVLVERRLIPVLDEYYAFNREYPDSDGLITFTKLIPPSNNRVEMSDDISTRGARLSTTASSTDTIFYASLMRNERPNQGYLIVSETITPMNCTTSLTIEDIRTLIENNTTNQDIAQAISDAQLPEGEYTPNCTRHRVT